jgi:hypothetical protein
MPTKKESMGIGALVLIAIVMIYIVAKKKGQAAKSGYLDYMPTAVQPCASDYRCGATTRQQAAMENNLYADLLESGRYALPETVTPDQVNVIASDAEPTGCMMARAARANENPKPEGMHDTWATVDDGFENMKRRMPKKYPIGMDYAPGQTVYVR